jgi:bifunctional DNA-binding transcriptional regulator/antitoxin component of YhaV-PrlF toxin-antitoxin module
VPGRRVGPKGQLVIEKEIRVRLGVQPGSVAIQKLVGDHVEIRFAPPPPRVELHNRSLLGILKSDVSVPHEEWAQARQRAWAEAAWEEERKWRASRERTSTPRR